MTEREKERERGTDKDARNESERWSEREAG